MSLNPRPRLLLSESMPLGKKETYQGISLVVHEIRWQARGQGMFKRRNVAFACKIKEAGGIS